MKRISTIILIAVLTKPSCSQKPNSITQTVKDLMDTDSTFRESVMELQQKVQLAAM